MNSPKDRLRTYAFMKRAREFDARFEAMLLTGRISKWYSAIGNEGITVPAGLALEAGDVLCSLHRDVGAILAFYLDPALPKYVDRLTLSYTMFVKPQEVALPASGAPVRDSATSRS